ncbi:MAG: hypothetical protein DRO67_09385 [Candidatus Asgardarchaeum californiense]|nr:MAG: hypothetical protein DRO67_09385 [Candidatus Asgardarchaeum californiense]
MANLSKKARIKFKINGQLVDAPIEWKDINITASFPNDSIQPKIDIEEFTFVLKELQILRQWVADGNIFQGLPFEFSTYNEDNEYLAFDGYINLADQYKEILADGKVVAKIQLKQDLSHFFTRLEALSYGYLEDKGIFSNSDYTEIDYVVEKKIQAFEILMSSIVLFLMVKQSIQAAYDLAETYVNITTKPVTGILAYAIAVALFQVIYTGLMITVVINLANEIFKTFIPPRRTSKTITQRTLLENVAAYLGYTLDSNITDLDEVVYLPSNQRLDDVDSKGFINKTKGISKGVPFITDNGYRCIDMFEIIRQCYNGKYAIEGDVLHFYNEDDPFWLRNSTFKMASIRNVTKEYNTDELIANRLIKFPHDPTDSWTIDKWKGNSYYVLTDSTETIPEDAKFIKGHEEINIGVSLGVRKDKLNALEKLLAEVGGAVDELTGIFGGGTNFKDKVKSKVGVLKVSQNDYQSPKFLKLTNGKLAANHRDKWGAKYLYEKYYFGKSFVANDFYGQKAVFNDVKIPFGLKSFLNLINNSYFSTFENETAKATRISWNIDSLTADIDYYTREVYTRKLKETKIEPNND